jgi:hypothetical protein
MGASSHAGYGTAANIDRMMERLGIDVGYSAAPRFGLLTSCTQRNCCSCTKHAACTEWLAKNPDPSSGPPKFCPNFDLLCELYYDFAAGHHAHRMI